MALGVVWLVAVQVNYRETVDEETELRYLHKKQTGGSGQYADVQLRLTPGEALLHRCAVDFRHSAC